MKLLTVESSMIYAVGYRERERVLEVVFTTGQLWRYLKVPKAEYLCLLDAESKGQYMRANIIGTYDEEKIRRHRHRGKQKQS